MTEINTTATYLIQRMNKPHDNTPKGDFMVKADQVFGEGGGGLRLSDEARGLFRYVTSWDYMGSAEFEFGALPKALGKMAKSELVVDKFVLEAKHIKRNWWHESRARDARRAEIKAAKDAGKEPPRAKPTKLPELKDPTFYILCVKGWEDYTKALITNLAKDTQTLKDSSNMTDVLDPTSSYAADLQGWLDIDNGIFFFIDKIMFERVCRIFQVDTKGIT
jgi:hypothetical protein